jgi:hypothetical protein
VELSADLVFRDYLDLRSANAKRGLIAQGQGNLFREVFCSMPSSSQIPRGRRSITRRPGTANAGVTVQHSGAALTVMAGLWIWDSGTGTQAMIRRFPQYLRFDATLQYTFDQLPAAAPKWRWDIVNLLDAPLRVPNRQCVL